MSNLKKILRVPQDLENLYMKVVEEYIVIMIYLESLHQRSLYMKIAKGVYIVQMIDNIN